MPIHNCNSNKLRIIPNIYLLFITGPEALHELSHVKLMIVPSIMNNPNVPERSLKFRKVMKLVSGQRDTHLYASIC